MDTQKVWFITGASKGMGLEITKTALAKGDKVIATSRSIDELKAVLHESENKLLLLEVDITLESSVKAAIEKSIQKFRKIDIVVNNAGYYLVGSVEELSDIEFRRTLDVNLFGTVNVIRHIMPYLRAAGTGHIINTSSNMGYIGYANTGSYNAAKFAVIGLSEALAEETKAFGINVTVIAPGMFRTNFMSDSTLAVAKTTIDEYNVHEHVHMLRSFHGNQPGDPKKLANVLYEISRMQQPPLHLPLGTDSYSSILEVRKKEAMELQKWQKLSLSTDFD